MKIDLLIIHPDESTRRDVAARALRRGLNCCETDSAVDGVILAREARPPAVVIDAASRGMDGFMALELIRMDVGTQTRILVTGAGERGLQSLARELGADQAVGSDGGAIDLFLDQCPSSTRRSATIASLP
jgi:DNA-binding response OmpR family regulator